MLKKKPIVHKNAEFKNREKTAAAESLPEQTQPAKIQPGVVEISSFPPGADVYLNKELIGNTEKNFFKTLKPGKYIFRFVISVFDQTELEVTVKSGELNQVNARLSSFGFLTVIAIPPRVTCYIDGQKQEDFPVFKKRLKVGEHIVRVEKDGYLPQEERILISTHNQTVSKNFILKKENEQ